MRTKWSITKLSDGDESKARDLALGLNLSLVMGRLLVQRGIRYLNKARQFLKPNLRQLLNPFLLQDMDKAVARLNKVIDKREHILIFGDYDVDGTTSVALVYNIFRDYFLPEEFLHYAIPERNDDGHGINYRIINEAKAKGVSVIVALDCGSKAHEEIAYARQLGIDFIVCDHHQTDDILPPALALLNPKRADNTYENTDLSGCAVGFKLMQALCYSRHIALPHLKQYLELVAISLIVDLVPLTGENRVMVTLGLDQLNYRPSLGLRYLIQNVDLVNKRIDSYDIMYKLGPRLNAAGRMDSGAVAVSLLIAKDNQTAYSHTLELEALNTKRRLLDRKVTKQAKQLAEQQPDFATCRCLVLFCEDWHQGVLGIVASRLNEYYNRPTLIIARKGDLLVGSARSLPNVDLYAAFEAVEDLLDSYGGHRQAVGFTLRHNNLEKFTHKLKLYFEQDFEDDEIVREIEVDGVLELNDVTLKLLDEIKLLAPFGLNNQEPTFASFGMLDAGGSEVVGKQMQHLKLNLCQQDGLEKIPLRGIGFGLGNRHFLVEEGKSFDICYTLSENKYFSQSYLELQIKDILSGD